MTIAQNDIMRIKKLGNLFALDGNFQLWQLDSTIYYISVDGSNYGVWCAYTQLKNHLQKLFHLTGKRFEEWETTLIMHPELLPVY